MPEPAAVAGSGVEATDFDDVAVAAAAVAFAAVLTAGPETAAAWRSAAWPSAAVAGTAETGWTAVAAVLSATAPELQLCHQIKQKIHL